MSSVPPTKIEGSKPVIGRSNRHSLNVLLKQVFAGATSAVVTRFFCQPLEVLKIRFQLQIEALYVNTRVSRTDFNNQSSKYTSIYQACRVIYKDEGLVGFWKGHNAGQVLGIVYGVTQFWTYEQIFLELSQTQLLKNRPYVSNFISGGTAGCVATVVSMPFDVIRTRMICQDMNSGYRNARSAIPSIVRDEGFKGLYRGLKVTLIQIGPLIGTGFTFYGLFNDMGAYCLKIQDPRKLPPWLSLISGGVAGTVSKLLLYPLDLIKRRLQVQGFHQHRQTFGKNVVSNGVILCIKNTLHDEGVFGFYKGAMPTLLRAGLSTALYLTIYKEMKRILHV